MMKTIDALAQGRGLSLAQAKVTHSDGTVSYHVSRPNLRPWDIVGWIWYAVHLHNLKRSR